MSREFLWQDAGGAAIDEAITEFTAGEDIAWDRRLFAFDIRATAAHVRGLERIGILDAGETARLCSLLDELLDPRTLYNPLDRAGLQGVLETRLAGIPADDLEQRMDRWMARELTPAGSP